MMLSAGMAAAAGGLYAVVLLVVTPPTVFGMLASAQALIVALFGGVGVYWGPVIGAAILVPLAETLHAELGHIVPGIQGVVYGLAIIAIILLAPDGIYWRIRDRFAARAERPLSCRRSPRVAMPATDTSPISAAAASAASGRPLLELDGVVRAFGGLKAVDGVSLAVAEGAIHGIIGPNGAGKTTLFNVINGFLPADAGSIRFAGAELVGAQAASRLPPRHRPHLPGGARLPAHDGAGERDGRRLRRRQDRPRGDGPRRRRAGPRRAWRGRPQPRRRPHHPPAAPDGAGARACPEPAAPAARRDAGRPRPRGAGGGPARSSARSTATVSPSSSSSTPCTPW